MKRLFFLVSFAFLLLFSSCSPFSLVNSTVYNNSNLASYKTFRIVTPADGSMPPIMSMVGFYNIAVSIRTRVLEVGFP